MSARICLSANQTAVTNLSPCQTEMAFDRAATPARLFLAGYPGYRAALRQALTAGDPGVVARIAYILRGAVGTSWGASSGGRRVAILETEWERLVPVLIALTKEVGL
jgi:hypothetical protein